MSDDTLADVERSRLESQRVGKGDGWDGPGGTGDSQEGATGTEPISCRWCGHVHLGKAVCDQRIHERFREVSLCHNCQCPTREPQS